MSEEDYLDQVNGYEPNSQAVKHFLDKVEDWIERVKIQTKFRPKKQNNVIQRLGFLTVLLWLCLPHKLVS